MSNGFSLIELLIVLAIVSILSAIVYPSYRSHITHAHRIDGQTALLDLANRMERYYTEHNTYQTATIGLDKVNSILTSPISDGGWYSLSIREATNTTYILQATPIGTQATNDTLCQSLTFTSSGIKGIASAKSTPTSDSSFCW